LGFFAQAQILLTELNIADAIFGFGSVGPNQLLSQYQAKWGFQLARAVQ